jgi:hypothetical protein
MGWTDRRSKNGIVDGIAKNQNKIKGEEHMNDLIERLRLGDGTSADHELLLEAADALALTSYPPKHTWVGLTAEEAAECWTTSATQTWKNFEAKLKDKNT